MADTDKLGSITEESQVTIDLKSLVGIVAVILAMAGIYFTLTAQIATLQLDVIRMKDAVDMNNEFRVKWPRGELGALPDDAKQDLRIQFLQDDLAELKAELKKLKEGRE